jgi:2-amino-4-hydroxy-6-hydroxymethyldihydropteridine diphosphokinase
VTLAYVGIGSNLEDPRRNVEQALEELKSLERTTLLRHSSLYRSAPIGYSEQPQFVNAVAALETALAPERLLDELQAIEARHGRRRSFANAPRTLDLDLLLYGKQTIRLPRLTVPHPRMHERAFVLRPLLELDPQAEIPGKGNAAELLAGCSTQDVQRISE